MLNNTQSPIRCLVTLFFSFFSLSKYFRIFHHMKPRYPDMDFRKKKSYIPSQRKNKQTNKRGTVVENLKEIWKIRQHQLPHDKCGLLIILYNEELFDFLSNSGIIMNVCHIILFIFFLYVLFLLLLFSLPLHHYGKLILQDSAEV